MSCSGYIVSQWESYEWELNGLGLLAAVGSCAVQEHAWPVSWVILNLSMEELC